jgi:hypothetical protein
MSEDVTMQTEARKIAKREGGIATTRDRAAGRWEKTYEWIVLMPDGSILDPRTATS